MEQFVRIKEYLIRHFHLSDVCFKHIDNHTPDRKCESSGKARERLLRSYEPPAFCCDAQNEILSPKWNLQIVIPMYNSQEYVISCIDSIVNQKTKYTYKVIVIDDGSTDSATPLVRARYEGYPVEVIRQANKGTAAARNLGITKIEADYVMFVDSDDMLAPGAIEMLLDKAYEEDLCIVEGSYEFMANGFRKAVLHENSKFAEPCSNLWGFAWAKVIRAPLFNDICFPKGYWYEDTMISYILYTKCKNAATIKNVVYKYRRNKKGFSHIRGNATKLLDSFWVLVKTLEALKVRNVDISAEMYDYILGSMITCSKRLMYMNDEIRREVLEAFSDLLNSEFSDFSTENFQHRVFEKVVRNNDYVKYNKLVMYIRE